MPLRARAGTFSFAVTLGLTLSACTALFGIDEGTLTGPDASTEAGSPAADASHADGPGSPGNDAPPGGDASGDQTVPPEAGGDASPDVTADTAGSADTGTTADTSTTQDTGPPPQGDAGVGKVGTLGDACSTPGATACNGNDSQVVLICQGGAWAQSGATCPSSQRCDSTVGACANVAAPCVGLQPGDEVCSGGNAVQCGVDLTSTTTVDACGAHQTCTTSGSTATCNCNIDPQCPVAGTNCTSGMAFVTCQTDAQGCIWASGSTACTNGACSGSAGSASCCTNDAACTTAGSTCTGGSTSFTCTLGANGCLTGAAYSCQGSSAGNACVPDGSGVNCGCAVDGDCAGCQSGFVCLSGSCGCNSTADCMAGDCCNLSQSTVLCYPIGEGCTM